MLAYERCFVFVNTATGAQQSSPPIFFNDQHFLFLSCSNLSTQNMVNFRWIFKITRKKIGFFFFGILSFQNVYQIFGPKNHNGGGGGFCMSLISKNLLFFSICKFQLHDGFCFTFSHISFFIFYLPRWTLPGIFSQAS